MPLSLRLTKKAEVAEVPATAGAAQPKTKAAVAVEPLSPSELKEMLAKSKESEDDDCLMCGS